MFAFELPVDGGPGPNVVKLVFFGFFWDQLMVVFSCVENVLNTRSV